MTQGINSLNVLLFRGIFIELFKYFICYAIINKRAKEALIAHLITRQAKRERDRCDRQKLDFL